MHPAKKEVSNQEHRFCSHCGKPMNEEMIGAETAFMYYGDVSTIPVGSAFDTITGKRQFVKQFTCPRWTKTFGAAFFGNSPHDKYFLDKIIT